MEILTDRCLKDFTRWVRIQHQDNFGYIDIEPTSIEISLFELTTNCQLNVISSWFETLTDLRQNGCIYSFRDDFLSKLKGMENKSIEECLSLTIENANRIYNENNKN